MFVYVECLSSSCMFRFPVELGPDDGSTRCPRCGSPTQPVTEFAPSTPPSPLLSPKSHPLAAILDNLRSAYNVGSIFRTADACGVSPLYLGGITPLPTHPGVKKTALGAEETLPWSYTPNSVKLAQTLKHEGYFLLGVETAGNARSLFDLEKISLSQPVTIVVGNEIAGIDPGLQHLCDTLVWIPMRGYKRSLNVAVAFGIVAYFLRYLTRGTLPEDIDEGSARG